LILISDNIKGSVPRSHCAVAPQLCSTFELSVIVSAAARDVAFGRCESKGLHSAPHRTDRMHHRYCLTTLNECDESQVELHHSFFLFFCELVLYDCHRSDFYFRQQSIITPIVASSEVDLVALTCCDSDHSCQLDESWNLTNLTNLHSRYNHRVLESVTSRKNTPRRYDSDSGAHV